VFLPKIVKWARAAHGRTRAEHPLFPGYFFLRATLDKSTHAEVLRARGVVRVLGERWDRLAAIPDEEVDAIQRMVTCGQTAFGYQTPQGGQRVRIVDGPLKGLDGQFIRAHTTQGIFVVSVTLLQRSVATEVPASCVQPA
jgi:transcription antitermination factor NusG